jgi:hypothetical protein
MDRDLIWTAIYNAEEAAYILRSAVDQPYCKEFKGKISNAKDLLKTAYEQLELLEQGDRP